MRIPRYQLDLLIQKWLAQDSENAIAIYPQPNGWCICIESAKNSKEYEYTDQEYDNALSAACMNFWGFDD